MSARRLQTSSISISFDSKAKAIILQLLGDARHAISLITRNGPTFCRGLELNLTPNADKLPPKKQDMRRFRLAPSNKRCSQEMSLHEPCKKVADSNPTKGLGISNGNDQGPMSGQWTKGIQNYNIRVICIQYQRPRTGRGLIDEESGVEKRAIDRFQCQSENPRTVALRVRNGITWVVGEEFTSEKPGGSVCPASFHQTPIVTRSNPGVR